MTVRKPKPDSAARILTRELAKLGHSVKYSQALELLAKVQGFNHHNAKRAHEAAQPEKPKFEVTCPVLPIGAPALTSKQLKDMEVRDDIRAIVEIEANDLLDEGMTLDSCLDLVSERITGSLCGLTDISYKVVHLPNPTENTVAFQITAAEIEWETLDDGERGESEDEDEGNSSTQSPRRTLSAIEFVPGDFRQVLSVDFRNFFDWLDSGRGAAEEELDEEVIEYEYDGRSGSNWLSIGDLVNATVGADGMFTLEDGEYLYLIDQNHQRWTPTPAEQRSIEDAVNERMTRLADTLRTLGPKPLSTTSITFPLSYLRYPIVSLPTLGSSRF